MTTALGGHHPTQFGNVKLMLRILVQHTDRFDFGRHTARQRRCAAQLDVQQRQHPRMVAGIQIDGPTAAAVAKVRIEAARSDNPVAPAVGIEVDVHRVQPARTARYASAVE